MDAISFNPSVPEPADALLEETEYKALVAKLESLHPEDFVNVFSKVLMDRLDLTYTASHVEGFYQVAQMTVQNMGPRDKFFTISIQSSEL